MNFWEAFFSTDKIIYAIISSILFGIFTLIIVNIFDLQIEEIEIQIIMGIGFVLGNIIKTNKLINSEQDKIKQQNSQQN